MGYIVARQDCVAGCDAEYVSHQGGALVCAPVWVQGIEGGTAQAL